MRGCLVFSERQVRRYFNLSRAHWWQEYDELIKQIRCFGQYTVCTNMEKIAEDVYSFSTDTRKRRWHGPATVRKVLYARVVYRNFSGNVFLLCIVQNTLKKWHICIPTIRSKKQNESIITKGKKVIFRSDKSLYCRYA
jgi:hypothetical protein